MRASHLRPAPASLRGLYAVTSAAVCGSTDVLVAAVEDALAGGARMIQYRDKWNDAATRGRNAHALAGLCHAHEALLIVNDDVALAAASGADGVHLGSSDTSLEQARRLLGAEALIGLSCGDSLDRAHAAARAGADYVAFGRFFESRTRPDAPPCTLQTLRAARARLELPICAIGGITPDNARRVIEAGADLVAAVDGVFGAPDVRAAAALYAKTFAPA